MTEYENPLSRGPSSAQRAETVRYFKHALRAQVRDNYLMFIYEKPGKSDARYDTLAVCRTSRDTSASINHSCKTCRKNFYTFIQARRNDNFYAHSGLCVSPKERERHSELSSSRKIKKIADSPYNDLALESSEKFHVAAKRPSRRGGGGECPERSPVIRTLATRSEAAPSHPSSCATKCCYANLSDRETIGDPGETG